MKSFVKKEKKKKTWWQKLIIFIVVLAVIWLIFHFAFKYFSGVVVENLSSIAESESYIEKGNDKVVLGTYFENIDYLLDESVKLSAYAYDPENEDENRFDEIQAMGYSNVMHYDNKPSQLYKSLAKKNKNAAVMLSPVNATVATKPLDDGNVLIAIAFKGTDSSNINDALSDMYKAVDKNGFHKGFMFNAQQFDKKSEDIVFDLNGEKINLKQIVNEAVNPNCKYKILVTGHSLGAAVADIYSGYILKNYGVDSSNVVTITYGTPKSCSASYEYTDNNIINIINTDDMVPTIGAENHLGTCLYFTPTDDFRKSNYGEYYVETNAYNSYSDILSSVRSNLIAHNLYASYMPATQEIKNNHSNYFVEK